MDDLQHSGLIPDSPVVGHHPHQPYAHQLSSTAAHQQLQQQQQQQQPQHHPQQPSQQQHPYGHQPLAYTGQHHLLDPSLQSGPGLHQPHLGQGGPSQVAGSSGGGGGRGNGHQQPQQQQRAGATDGSHSDGGGGGNGGDQQQQGGAKKKRAAPTRWFAADDAAMVRVLLDEKRRGHETEHGFLSSSWDKVVEAVQETTLQGQKKDVQPCKDRYKLMIRTLYQPFKELMMHSDFHWSETEQRFHATADAWAKQIEVNPLAARYKSHSFPLYQEFEELVGYRRQAQLGQLLHMQELANGGGVAGGTSSTGSPVQGAHQPGGTGGQGSGGQGASGSYGDLSGLGMGAMEESFMRVDDGDEGGLMGSVLDDTYAQPLPPPPPPPPPPPTNKRPYPAVTTTSLANTALGGPPKRPYLGPSSTGPSSSGAGGPGLGLDRALGALENAQTLAEINAQLKELMVLVRRGVEIGEKVFAALPQGVMAAAAADVGDGAAGADGDTGNGAHQRLDVDGHQNGRPSDAAPSSTATTGPATASDQAGVLIGHSPYLSPDQKAVLTERAGWDLAFVHDVLATAAAAAAHDAGDGIDGEGLRRQLYENALIDAGAI